MHARITAFLIAIEKKDPSKEISYQGGPFDEYKEGQIDSYKKIVISMLEGYLNKNDKKLTTEQVADLTALISKLEISNQFISVYTYLTKAKETFKALGTLSKLIDYARDFPMFTSDLKKEMKKVDSFHNPVQSSLFETELALAILEFAPKAALEKINERIIKYCRDHQSELNDTALKEELIKLHICVESDFENTNSINKLIELLSRPLSDPNNVSECTSLHLIFFNYRHIYDPTLDVNDSQEKVKLEEERHAIHKKVRPEQPGEMFDPSTRGYKQKYSNYETKEFGITDPSLLPLELKDWHRVEATPHKYRVDANLQSPVIKAMRSYHVPYIAGPSGIAADCAEGLHFLMPNLSETEKQEYFNLLAAGEVGQGRHSIHEIIMPLCNLDLFQPFSDKLNQLKTQGKVLDSNKQAKQPWFYLDYSKTYEQFLSPAFKHSKQYQELVEKYPHFLDPERHKIESPYVYLNKNHERDVVKVQQFVHAIGAYSDLNEAIYWHESELIKDEKVNLKQFQTLSKNNLENLKQKLGNLTMEEKNFLREFSIQDVNLAHYTKSADAIFKSKVMLSNTKLKKILGEGNFNDSSSADIQELANGSYVFFRYELEHNNATKSRFGEGQIIINADTTSMFKHGWVSLYEMLKPEKTSIVEKLEYEGNIVRSYHGPYSKGKFNYQYGQNTYDFDVVGTLFYGPDIRHGIALAMLSELRRIGGKYQKDCLTNLTTKDLNHTLSTLFRVEAKIPSHVLMDKVAYRYTAPEIMQEAIEQKDISTIEKQLNYGMNVEDLLASGNTAAFEACTIYNDEGIDVLKFLYTKGAKLSYAEATTAHVAAAYGNTQCVEFSLQNGVDINALDKNGRTPLSYACEQGQLDTVSFLLQESANVTRDDLIASIRGGHVNVMNEVLSMMPSVIVSSWINSQNNDGNTLAHLAAQYIGTFSRQYGRAAILEMLYKNGADLVENNHSNQSILHLAVENNHVELIKKIAELAKKDNKLIPLFNSLTSNNESPLELAVKNNVDAEIVSILLENGADATVKNKHSSIPLHAAIENGNPESIRVLVEKMNKEDIYLLTSDKNSSLHMAVTKFDADTINLLLDKNFNPDALLQMNIFDQSPLHLAYLYQRTDILDRMTKGPRFLEIIHRLDSDKANHRQILLNYAVEKNDFLAIEALLKKGADPTQILHIVVARGDQAITTLFLEHGATLTNTRTGDNSTIFHIAVDSGHLAVLQALLAHPIEKKVRTTLLNKLNRHEISPLQIAVEKENMAMVELLLDHGADPNQILRGESTSLHWAAQKHRVEIIQLLIKNHADVNAKDRNGNTPLYWAIQMNNVEAAKMLLENGADLTIKSQNGQSPALLAIQRGQADIIKAMLTEETMLEIVNALSDKTDEDNIYKINLLSHVLQHGGPRASEIVEALLKKGAINQANFNEIAPHYLEAALKKDFPDPDVIKVLLKAGIDPNMKNQDGNTPIYLAAERGLIGAVKILMENGADIRTQTSSGNLPFQIAVTNGNSEVVNYMMEKNIELEKEKGVDVDKAKSNLVNDKNANGATALHAAIQPELLEYLLKNHAKVNEKTLDGSTALHYAASEGDTEKISILLKYGADINIKDEDGRTALHCAILEGQIEVIKLLAANHADFNCKDNDDNLPLVLAVSRQPIETACAATKILLENGADPVKAEIVDDVIYMAHLNHDWDVAIHMLLEINNPNDIENSEGIINESITDVANQFIEIVKNAPSEEKKLVYFEKMKNSVLGHIFDQPLHKKSHEELTTIAATSKLFSSVQPKIDKKISDMLLEKFPELNLAVIAKTNKVTKP